MLWKSKRQAIRWQDMHAQASSYEAVTLSSLKDLNSFPVENVNCINYPVGEGWKYVALSTHQNYPKKYIQKL